ncbi:MAG: hypothetical protein ABJB86_22005 [Bacteroidota bacterium]
MQPDKFIDNPEVPVSHKHLIDVFIDKIKVLPGCSTFLISYKYSFMTKAYLQNKKAQYYYLTSEGKIALCDVKKEIQSVPEVFESAEETVSGNKHCDSFAHTSFIFRNDGCRILSNLFFMMGTHADCILTLEEDNELCGDLDFSTARIYGQKEIRINCRHF